MEVPGGGILGRLSEKVLGYIALAIVLLVGIAVYQMPAETKGAIWSGIWRSIVWVIIAAGVPWSAALFVRRVLEISSNWAGVGLVAGLTLVDLIAGVVLMTAWPSGGWTWAAAIGAIAVAATYNYLVAEYLADTSG